jgi:hypothetical protein
MMIPMKPRYRLVGWGYTKDSMAHTLFEIQLDAGFAKHVLNTKPTMDVEKFQRRFIEICRETIDKYTTVTFFDNSMLLRTFSVSGNCCCMGISGTELDPEHWRENIAYSGHNNDTIDQAFRLLWVFTVWLEYAEAFLPDEATP